MGGGTEKERGRCTDGVSAKHQFQGADTVGQGTEKRYRFLRSQCWVEGTVKRIFVALGACVGYPQKK